MTWLERHEGADLALCCAALMAAAFGPGIAVALVYGSIPAWIPVWAAVGCGFPALGLVLVLLLPGILARADRRSGPGA